MMPSSAPALRLLVSTVVTLAAMGVGACSNSSSSSPSPSPSPTTTTGTVTAVSASYKSLCVSCHGSDGTLTSITSKVLKGTTLTAAKYSAAVRNGGSGMSAYTSSQISDADITNDYKFFTK